MAGLHSSDLAGLKFLYNMAGLHSSGFIKFVQYGWITQ